jgi:hypothetical protein
MKVFAGSQTVVLGLPQLIRISIPVDDFHPSRIMTNSLCENFVISEFVMADGSAVIDGKVDTFLMTERKRLLDRRFDNHVYESNMGGIPIDPPPCTLIRLIGEYTGIVPSPFRSGNDFLFSVIVFGTNRAERR